MKHTTNQPKTYKLHTITLPKATRPLLKLWNRFTNNQRQRIGWERVSTGQLPQLGGWEQDNS